MTRDSTVWDVIEDIRWGDRFESFSPEELRRLQRYADRAEDLRLRPLFTSPISMSFKASPQESYQRLTHAGDDALRSAAMTFRQMWLKGERTRFESIHQLLGDHAKPGAPDGVDIKAVLGAMARRYTAAKSKELMKRVWKDDPVGEPIRSFSAEDAIERWFYSGPRFHTDDDKEQFVQSWSREAVEWSLIKAMRGAAFVMWELETLVRGALGEANAATVA